jgi:hypothetical protein
MRYYQCNYNQVIPRILETFTAKGLIGSFIFNSTAAKNPRTTTNGKAQQWYEFLYRHNKWLHSGNEGLRYSIGGWPDSLFSSKKPRSELSLVYPNKKLTSKKVSSFCTWSLLVFSCFRTGLIKRF